MAFASIVCRRRVNASGVKHFQIQRQDVFMRMVENVLMDITSR